MNDLYKKLKEFGRVKNNALMAKHTSFKIGGPVRFLVEAEDEKKLISLLKFLRGEGVEFFIMGGGSNLLWPDEEYEGVVVKFTGNKVSARGNKITAEAGAPLAAVVALAAKNNLSGLEWAVGIPGTVGGAVRGNAGAMGFDTASVVEEVEAWRDDELAVLKKNECGFGYRDSMFKRDSSVILRVHFTFAAGDQIQIATAMKKYLDQRLGRYPKIPSAGSFFKNIRLENWPGDKAKLPPLFLERGTVPVGWLAEQVGAKGFVVGGAKVSDEHGNFIVNFNHATQADVLALVEELKSRVYNKFGVEIEPEVEIVK